MLLEEWKSRSRKEEGGTGGTGNQALATLLIKSPRLSVHPVSPPQSTQGWLLPTLFSHLDGGSKSGCEFPSF